MPSDGSERRREPRAPIELRVEYKRLNTFFADYTENIFALDLPTLAEPLRLRGRVMWTTTIDEASKANPAGMGIEFQYVDDTERREMEKIVEQLAVGQLGEHLADKLLGKK